jgi:exodeoxyribonuclease III
MIEDMKKNDTSLRIVSWNVNGIRAVHRKGALNTMINELMPDIVCFQETKAQEGQCEVDLPEYTEYWNSAVKKGYSGTAIFTKVKPLSVVKDIPEKYVKQYGLERDTYGDPNTEGRVYTPNSKSGLERLSLRADIWDKMYVSYMSDLQKIKPVIFCGDLNAAHTEDDLHHPEANEYSAGFTKEERRGIDAILKAGFFDTFRHFTQGKGFYTWWSNFSAARERNVGWRIDYFFMSNSMKERLVSAEIHAMIFGSDHCPVSIKVNI